MLLSIARSICYALVLSALAFAQTQLGDSPALAAVRLWIEKAAHTSDPVEWANDLMEADATAEKLEQKQATGCCGVRCVRVNSLELHYRFNELEGKEDYQHDLLQTIAIVHIGTKEGADALMRLLPTGCQTMSGWIPLFRTVLDIIEQKRWRDLADLRLTEIRGEAYETWWSMSRMSKDDVFVTDAGMSSADFTDGAPLARERAIQSYEMLVTAHRASADLMGRLAKLKSNQDTGMRKWVCYSD